jgi:hypothetical protein
MRRRRHILPEPEKRVCLISRRHKDLNDLEKEAADSAPKRNEIPPAGGSDLMKMAQSRQRIEISSLSALMKSAAVPSKLPSAFCKHGANRN